MIQLLIFFGATGLAAGAFTVEVSFSETNVLVVGCPVEVTCNVLQDSAKSITYSWKKDAAVMDGKTKKSFTIPALETSDAATYKCTATEDGGTGVEGSKAMAVVANKDNSAKPTILPIITSKIGTGDKVKLTCGGPSHCKGMTYKWWKGSTLEGDQKEMTWEITASKTAETVKYKCQSTVKTVDSTVSSVKDVITVDIKKIEVIGAEEPVVGAANKAKYECKIDASTADQTYSWEDDQGKKITGSTDKTPFEYDTSGVTADAVKKFVCKVGIVKSDVLTTTAKVAPKKPTASLKQGGLTKLTKDAKYMLMCANDASKSYMTGVTYEWKKGAEVIESCKSQDCEITAAKSASYTCKVTIPTTKASQESAALSTTVKNEKGKACTAIANCDGSEYSGDCIASICACSDKHIITNDGCEAGSPGTRVTYSLVVLLLAAFTGYLMKL